MDALRGIIAAAITLVGAGCLILTIRAFVLGVFYMGASFQGWHWPEVEQFRNTPLRRLLFKVTPFGMMIAFAWAGFAVVKELFWFLGSQGVFNREVEEWMEYRITIASCLGIPMGLALTHWLGNFTKEIVLLRTAAKDETETT